MEDNVTVWQTCLQQTTSQVKDLEAVLGAKRRKIREFNYLLNDIQYRLLYDCLPECAIIDIIYSFANLEFCQKCKDYYPMNMYYCLSCMIPTIIDLEYDEWHYLQFPVVFYSPPNIMRWREEDKKMYFLQFCVTHNPNVLQFETSPYSQKEMINFHICRSSKKVYIIFAIGYLPSIKKIRRDHDLDDPEAFQNWSSFETMMFGSF